MPAAASDVGQYGYALIGKVVVDVSSPFDLTTFTDLVTPQNSSAAQEIAKTAPAGASVVKALTPSPAVSWPQVSSRAVLLTCTSPEMTQGQAKACVSTFIESLGLPPLDTGDLKYAH